MTKPSVRMLTTAAVVVAAVVLYFGTLLVVAKETKSPAVAHALLWLAVAGMGAILFVLVVTARNARRR